MLTRPSNIKHKLSDAPAPEPHIPVVLPLSEVEDGSKWAMTVVSEVMVTTKGLSRLGRLPDQPANSNPSAAVPVSVTSVPSA